MKYAVVIGSCTVIYIASFIRIGSDIQKLIGRDSQTHRQHAHCISLPSFFSQNMKSTLKVRNCIESKNSNGVVVVVSVVIVIVTELT
jgi:hypothetical protein